MIAKEKHPIRVLFFRDHEKAFEGPLPGIQAHVDNSKKRWQPPQ
jgi:hypothetical protein